MVAFDLPDDAGKLTDHARTIMARVESHNLMVATAESCTGGLLASLLTDIDGLSSSFDRGFVTYSVDAKCELLGVPGNLISMHGVVSREVAVAMAQGALSRSAADLAVAITGFAGPAGKRDEEGLVHLAVASKAKRIITRECHFGAAGREVVRRRAAYAALEMLDESISGPTAAAPSTLR